MQKRPVAYAMLITSMLIWGSLALFVKNVGYTSAEIVLARVVLGLIFLLNVYGLRKTKSPKGSFRRNLPRLLVSGAFMGLNWLCLFESYRWVDVSVATLCYYMAPVFVLLGSLIFFRQRLSLTRAAGMAAAVVGMVITTGAATNSPDPAKGVLLALASALLYASVTLIAKSAKDIGGLEMTIGQLLGALLVMLPYVLLSHEGPWHAPTLREGSCLLILGFVHTGAALYLYFSSVRLLPVQSAALLSYIDPLSALAFAAVFLNESMSGLQWLGAALILGGALFGELMENRRTGSAD